MSTGGNGSNGDTPGANGRGSAGNGDGDGNGQHPPAPPPPAALAAQAGAPPTATAGAPPPWVPPTYDERKVTWVMDMIADGQSVTEACREAAVPRATLLRWVIDDTPKGIADRYARARELQYEVWADRILEESSRVRIGDKVKRSAIADKDGNETGAFDVETTTGDMVERSRLHVDSLKWLLARLHPKKYGDSVANVTVNNDNRQVRIWKVDPFRNHREVMGERAPRSRPELIELGNDGRDDIPGGPPP